MRNYTFTQKAAIAFGVVFVLIGVLGFVPAAVDGSQLLGIFHINTLHNVIHLASGAAALLSAATHKTAKLYFAVFGIVYGLVTVLGFATHSLLGLMHLDLADNILHLVISLASLYLGFKSDDAFVA